MKLRIRNYLACVACAGMVGLPTQVASAGVYWNGSAGPATVGGNGDGANDGTTDWVQANFIDDSTIDGYTPTVGVGAAGPFASESVLISAYGLGGNGNPLGVLNVRFPHIKPGQEAEGRRLFMGVSASTSTRVGTASLLVEGKLTVNGDTSILGRDFQAFGDLAVSTINIDGGEILFADANMNMGEMNFNLTNGAQMRFGEIVGPAFIATGNLRAVPLGAQGNGAVDGSDDLTGLLSIDDSTVEMSLLRIDLSEAAATAAGGTSPLTGSAIHQFMIDIVGTGSLVIHDDGQAATYLPGGGLGISLYEMANIDGLIKGNGIAGNVAFTPTFNTDGTVNFVTITAIPEPSSLLLGLGSLLGAMMLRRRKV